MARYKFVVKFRASQTHDDWSMFGGYKTYDKAMEALQNSLRYFARPENSERIRNGKFAIFYNRRLLFLEAVTKGDATWQPHMLTLGSAQRCKTSHQTSREGSVKTTIIDTSPETTTGEE